MISPASGSIPGALGSLPSLLYFDLSNNQLTGSLAAYANALSANGSEILIYFNVSNNELSGVIPEPLEDMAVFNPELQIYLDM